MEIQAAAAEQVEEGDKIHRFSTGMRKERNIYNWLFILCLIANSTYGQGYYDTALRFGQNSIFGSVKSMGMGGVQMATGADGSAQTANPAAPGLMRKSEIQFGLMPVFNRSVNTYEGAEVEANKNRAPIGNFSLSLCNPKDDIQPGSFRGGTFTISYNRMAVFDRNSNWEGISKLTPGQGNTVKNSIIDYYLDQLKGYSPNDVLINRDVQPNTIPANYNADINLFYDTFVLDVDASKNEFTSYIPRGDMKKMGTWNQTLSQGIWNAGYSANFNDKIYIGASLGYFTSNFKSDVTYGETLINIDPGDPNFVNSQAFRGFNFNITKTINQQARGITGNIGILGRISDNFRIGGSVQLPTSVSISETFDSKMEANYNQIAYWYNTPDKQITLGAESAFTQTNDYNSKLRIPAKYRLGATYIAGKSGMFGIDLEYTDLSKTKLTEGDGGYNFKDENAIIQNAYKPTLNIKVGGELRFEDFRFRLGYAFMPTALRENSSFKNNANGDAHYFTGGIGGRYESWFWDAALVYGFWKTKYNYLPAISSDVSSKVTTTQFRLGVGFYF